MGDTGQGILIAGSEVDVDIHCRDGELCLKSRGFPAVLSSISLPNNSGQWLSQAIKSRLPGTQLI